MPPREVPRSSLVRGAFVTGLEEAKALGTQPGRLRCLFLLAQLLSKSPVFQNPEGISEE